MATAAADGRLYVPVRLLPDKYDIPHPYTPAPRPHADALLAAYDTAADAARRVTAALDDLAAAADAPSSLFAAARRASASAWPQQRREQGQRSVPRPELSTPVPGRTEQALRKLKIGDPALLLRAAVIDQSARDLVAEATTKAHSRDSVTGRASPPAPLLQQATIRPAQLASQDTPSTPQTAQTVQDHTSAAMRDTAGPPGHRPAPQQQPYGPRSADRR